MARQEECEAIMGALLTAKSVCESFIADVRNVHHHTEAVHFAHDILAEIAQAIVHGLVSGGIGPLVIAAVRQGHVADTERRETAQHAKVAVNHGAAFNTHERGDLAFFVRFANFPRGGGQHDVMRMLANLFAHGINLLQRLMHRFRSGNLAGNPDGEKNGAEPAFFHARNIYAAVGGALAEIEFAVEKALRGVIVRVYYDG